MFYNEFNSLLISDHFVLFDNFLPTFLVWDLMTPPLPPQVSKMWKFGKILKKSGDPLQPFLGHLKIKNIDRQARGPSSAARQARGPSAAARMAKNVRFSLSLYFDYILIF